MIDRTYCQTLASYNQWMNQKLYTLCATFSDEERKRDVGAFFHSIHGTLNHLLCGDRIWLNRFLGEAVYSVTWGQDLYSDFEELWQERKLTDEFLLKWTTLISDQWLAQPFEYTSQVDKTTRVLPAWLLVTHLFNHQTHHRGQLTTLLHQMGHDPGVTDLPWLPQLEIYSR